MAPTCYSPAGRSENMEELGVICHNLDSTCQNGCLSAASPASWWKITFIYSFSKINGTAWPLKSVQKLLEKTGTLILVQKNKGLLNEKIWLWCFQNMNPLMAPFGPPDPPALCKLLPLPWCGETVKKIQWRWGKAKKGGPDSPVQHAVSSLSRNALPWELRGHP